MPLTLTLGVHDLDATAFFYREILLLDLESFIPAPGHPPVLILRQGDAVVLFRELETLEALHPALLQNLSRHPLGVGASMEFQVPRLRPIEKNLARRNLHLLYELEDEQFGRREIWLHDPDGYLVILSEQQEQAD
ncbi:glyoxalase [Desulfuromonas versatilis]|uniref:Glyoxalase n=1 Tax=Desulfuromonas versatilis TaxID=2802975 RepID=A0ABN6DT65_9BACT|nr:VOC family protein [Desulfuromonas versatilis]BCR03347.1 glyoxalase [Desulfuromonas versatilis]